MDKTLFLKSEFLQKTLDAIPSILLIVDEDVRIHYMNLAGLEKLGVNNNEVYMKRGGEVLQCLHTYDVPEGCGRSESCKDCIVRNSVNRAFENGKVFRDKTRMQLVSKDKTIDIYLMVTTAPYEYEDKIYVLLTLEDISELIQLRSLLPICANCKKIRNDENYWQNIEEYISSHIDVGFSHGICGECAEKLYPGYLEK